MEQPKILVAIRKRPLNKKQQTKGDSDIISVKNMQTVIVSEYKQKVDLTKYLEETVFNFDFAFDQNHNNQNIYNNAVRPLVDSAFQGAKVTCFAYGQTGSGKTYTMNGLPSQGIPGLYTLAAQDLFAYLQDERFSHLKARLSFFQIYCGKLFDLLNKRQELKIRQDNKSNINIIGLQQLEINSCQQFIDLLNYGASQRVTSQNSANLDSSRSHAILQIQIKQGKKLFGKMSFIDLAGNQRGADHMDMSKQTRIDGAQINKSLLSLKQCIRALDQGKGHTPFRGSKLTMVLKDSFVGFCRTVMIGNVSPSSASSENTLNTLRYADRVKQLRKPSSTSGLSKQQQKARQMMLPRNNKNVLKIDINKDDDAQDIQMKRQNAQRSYGIIDGQNLMNNNNSNNNGSIVLGNKRFQNTMNSNQNNSNNATQKIQIKQPNLNNNNATKINMGINNVGNYNQNIQANLTNITKKTVNYVNINKYNNSNYNEDEEQIPGSMHRGYSQNPSYHHNYQEHHYSQQKVPSNFNKINSVSYNQNYNNQQHYNMELQNHLDNQKVFQGFGAMRNHQVNNFGNNNTVNINNPIRKNSSPMEIQSPLKLKMKFPNNNNIYTNKIVNSQPINNNFINPIKNNDIPPLFNHKSSQSQSQNTTHITQDFQIPNNWQQTVDMIYATEQPQRLLKLQQSICQNLLIQETNLIQKHSNTLRKQIDTIKQQMALISRLQMDRNAVQTRQYVRFLQDSIQQKLSSLELLRQNLQQFTYKLDQVEQIEERVKNIVGQNTTPSWDDEQLLDDLH